MTLREAMKNYDRDYFFLVSEDGQQRYMIAGVDPYSEDNPDFVNMLLHYDLRKANHTIKKPNDYFFLNNKNEGFYRNCEYFKINFESDHRGFPYVAI